MVPLSGSAGLIFLSLPSWCLRRDVVDVCVRPPCPTVNCGSVSAARLQSIVIVMCRRCSGRWVSMSDVTAYGTMPDFTLLQCCILVPNSCSRAPNILPPNDTVCLSVCLSVFLSVICQSVPVSVCLSVCLSFRLSVYVSLSVLCMSIYLFTCVPA